MQTFRIPTPAEMAAKKAAAHPAKPQEAAQATFKGYTSCPDKMAVYHLPNGL